MYFEKSEDEPPCPSPKCSAICSPDKIRFTSERIATFRSLGIGRRTFKVAGRLGVNRSSILLQVYEDERDTICIVPLDAVTGIDLQIQGLSEGTTYLPLNAKLTLEFSSSVILNFRGKEYSSMLLSGYFDLSTTTKLKSVANSIIKYKNFKLKKGLPSWGPWIPSYSPAKRKLIQTVLLLWTIFSVLWALWQLYQHFKLFRQLITYAGELIYTAFSPMIDFCSIYVGGFVERTRVMLLTYFGPLHVIFVAVSTPFVKLCSILYDAFKCFWGVMKGPLEIMWTTSLRPVGALVKMVFNGSRVLFRMLSSPFFGLLHCCLKPIGVMWKCVSSPIIGIYRFAKYFCMIPLWELICVPFGYFLGIAKDLYTVICDCVVSPARLLWECVQLPLSFIYRVLLMTVYKLREPIFALWEMVFNFIMRSSRFEFDANKERIAKIHRILHGSTKTFIHGVKSLFPSVLEVKKNIEDTILRKPSTEQTPSRNLLPVTPDISLQRVDEIPVYSYSRLEPSPTSTSMNSDYKSPDTVKGTNALLAKQEPDVATPTPFETPERSPRTDSFEYSKYKDNSRSLYLRQRFLIGVN